MTLQVKPYGVRGSDISRAMDLAQVRAMSVDEGPFLWLLKHITCSAMSRKMMQVLLTLGRNLGG